MERSCCISGLRFMAGQHSPASVTSTSVSSLVLCSCVRAVADLRPLRLRSLALTEAPISCSYCGSDLLLLPWLRCPSSGTRPLPTAYCLLLLPVSVCVCVCLWLNLALVLLCRLSSVVCLPRRSSTCGVAGRRTTQGSKNSSEAVGRKEACCPESMRRIVGNPVLH